MRKLVALVAGIAFSLGIGLAVPRTFAQAPAAKDEKKGEMMEKKGEMKKGEMKKGDKKAAAKKATAKKKTDKKMDKMEKKEEKK